MCPIVFRIQDILRKHRGFLTNYPGEASSDTEDASISKKQFAPERSIIDKIVSNESISFFSGIALGAFVFASVRYAPRYLAVRIGGQEKEKALKDADERARKANTKWVQQVGGKSDHE